MTTKRDFLQLADLTRQELDQLFARSAVLKADRRARKTHQTLAGRTLAIVLEKNSTRTRLSFEAAIHQLGGHAITLATADSQLSRGEPIDDTARVTSSYADGIVFRTFGDDRLQTLARASSVPVINGLSAGGHPVQLLADLFTVIERLGTLEGRKVAWVGDGASNMAFSWIEAARIFGFELRIGAPKEYAPPASVLSTVGAGARVHVVSDPREAVQGADVVSTDVWTSMGQEAESAERLRVLGGYQLDAALLAKAAPSAIVLHCLPAHRGEEITGEVIDSPQSAIFQEAENRLHTSKALLELLLA
ncbi:ornithine carbamoyltransferase [Pendulispora brunnea]|uniref:Ornithine carbamoyltransferase n=1 Tax=Pendulispora brunnea TaxID=2905690 RepID=A0ABZ2K4X5_9BACT